MNDLYPLQLINNIVVSDAPITDTFAHEIGSDGYSPDAGSAVEAALALLQAKN